MKLLNSSNLKVSIDIQNEFPVNSKFNQKLLNFEWNITKLENQTIEIQLLFSEPLYVSYAYKYDKLNV